MTIEKLMEKIEYQVLQEGDMQAEVTSLVYDSRKVTEGACFACETGLVFDGTDFLEAARAQGAVLAIMEKKPAQYPEGLTMLLVPNMMRATALMAANFYPQALEGAVLIGMTGTNGKTTTSTLMHHIFMENRLACGLIGTNENRIGREVIPAVHTTPYPFDLYALFEKMHEAKMERVVMEVSSHALAQYRVEGVRYQIGMFTNLSQDHLDYHKTMEAYLAAKCRLFEQCDVGLVNGDDPAATVILETGTCRFVTYGLQPQDEYRAENVQMDETGLQYDWYYGKEKLGHIQYPVPGKFNVYNTLAAASACHLTGLMPEVIIRALATQEGVVSGRFQTFHAQDGLTAIVDYAHTPDGLAKVLETAAEFAKGRIITVFGCGGDRDPKKRPVMGEIAGKLSQYCVITSDNPRTEDPEAIIDQVEEGMKKTECAYERLADRREAIARAIALAKPEDVVMIAGKGHEDYQIIGREKIHLDDREEVKKALESRQ